MLVVSASTRTFLETFGNVGQFAIPMLIGVYALFSGSILEALTLGALGGLQEFAVAELKIRFPRKRPRPYVEGKESPEDDQSFPSGHTGGAFLGASFALTMYGASHLLTLIALSLAIFVGLSRYLCGKHWTTDILAGALIGTINGYVVVQCATLIYKLLESL